MKSAGRVSRILSSLAMRLRCMFNGPAAERQVWSGLAAMKALTVRACWMTFTGGHFGGLSGNGRSKED